MSSPEKFENVTALCKANVFFDGKVISHTILFSDQSKKTLGVIYPGSYHFNTQAPERMDIIAGVCRVKLAGQPNETVYAAGQYFEVPGNSGFDIAVGDGIIEYVCSFQ